MSIPKDENQKHFVAAWRTYVTALEQSLNHLDEDIDEATKMAAY